MTFGVISDESLLLFGLWGSCHLSILMSLCGLICGALVCPVWDQVAFFRRWFRRVCEVSIWHQHVSQCALRGRVTHVWATFDCTCGVVPGALQWGGDLYTDRGLFTSQILRHQALGCTQSFQILSVFPIGQSNLLLWLDSLNHQLVACVFGAVRLAIELLFEETGAEVLLCFKVSHLVAKIALLLSCHEEPVADHHSPLLLAGTCRHQVFEIRSLLSVFIHYQVVIHTTCWRREYDLRL